ncbi:hypothetical protein [Microbacterium terrisoli]|jgi:hypothetical protein|uniref:hypothetical protein n=1 Tax=Microbacterium terrisoli TaxID=3242192 RepID=UPI002805C25A|nr:hypothetical protein [Microbacterium protaetiae]
MVLDGTQPLLIAMLAIFLFLVLCGALVLIVLSLRRPTTVPLVIAGALVVLGLVVVAIAPVRVPTLMGLILTLLGVTVAVLGGNPVSRRVLDAAAGSRVRETEDGGIMLLPVEGEDASAEPAQTLMRGGTAIGYLERLAAVLAIVVGYPEAIAALVALKGIGRFSELAQAESRERFIIGSMASLIWACLIGALLRFAMW